MKLKLKETLAKILQYLFKCERRTLLWTNPSQSLGAVTIPLDLSAYDAVEVYATIIDNDGPATVGGYFKANKGGSGIIQFGNLSLDNTSDAAHFLNLISRTFSVTNTGVTFSNGQMTYVGSAFPNWSGRAVPKKIYGIKMGGGTA